MDLHNIGSVSRIPILKDWTFLVLLKKGELASCWMVVETPAQ